MSASPRSSSKTVVLTADGRRRLEERLRHTAESMRDRAGSGSDGTDPGTDVQMHRAIALIDELQDVLDRARPPAEVPDDPSIVEVGDVVTVEHENGEVEQHILVDTIEAALGGGRVSVASPLGIALVGRRVGDAVTIDAPAGQYRCVVRARERAA